MKKLSLFLFSMLSMAFHVQAQASTAPPASVWDDPAILFYVAVGFIFIVALMVIVVAVYMLQVINLMTRQAAQERAEKLGLVYKPEPTLWEKIWQQSNDFVPMEKEKDILLDHNYDGIRELDNHLPPWWTGLFYGTIVFALVYLVFYHVSDTLPLSTQEYEQEVALAKEQARVFQASNPVAKIDETNVDVTTDVAALAEGKEVYLNNCASCHRRDAGGDIGPNLTDAYWLHGGDIKSIFKTVRLGITGTNMIAWEGFISPEKMKNVSSYILTLQGTNPENAKKPQGEMLMPASEVKSDSVKVEAGL